ncbi:unnamed protein product [Schistosoma curassoni]|uniref:G-protein coupled receptors family 1 profile domain-containing protein n=1 Tax=Schistosoma curassoni TaxID=6186 RepID=A0A183JPA5_9TREM|nr:unnamed protein product [Schistosoma curassoni]
MEVSKRNYVTVFHIYSDNYILINYLQIYKRPRLFLMFTVLYILLPVNFVFIWCISTGYQCVISIV